MAGRWFRPLRPRILDRCRLAPPARSTKQTTLESSVRELKGGVKCVMKGVMTVYVG